MKIFAFMFMIMTSLYLFSYEFEVKDISIDEYDMKNSLGKTVNDANDDACAVLRIETDIKKDIYLVGSDIFQREKTGPGEYYFFVSYRTNWIKFTAEGYEPFLYQIPLVMKPKKTYVLKLSTLGGTKENIPVVIITDPSDAKIFINSRTEMLSGIPMNLDPGKYDLLITKSGYITISDSISISESNKSFNYTLRPMDPGKLDIVSIPDSVSLIVDNIDRGFTPKILYMFSGKHVIELKKSGYKTLIDTIYINIDQEIQKTYKLENYAGNVKLNVKPLDAKILINKEDYSGKKNFALSPGMYKIELTRKGYQNYEKIINVELNVDTVFDIDLVAIKGRLNFNISPSEADCSLLEENQLINNWKGARFFQSLLIGEYKCVMKCSGYQTDTLMITINENQTNEINYFLKKEIRNDIKNPIVDFQKVKGNDFDPNKLYPYLTYSLDGTIKYIDRNNSSTDKYAYITGKMYFKILKPLYLGGEFSYNNSEYTYKNKNEFVGVLDENIEVNTDGLYFAPHIQVMLPYQYQPYFRYTRILANDSKNIKDGYELNGGFKYFNKNILWLACYDYKEGNQFEFKNYSIPSYTRINDRLYLRTTDSFITKFIYVHDRMNPVYSIYYANDYSYLETVGNQSGDLELSLFRVSENIQNKIENYDFTYTMTDSSYTHIGADLNIYLNPYLSSDGHIKITTNEDYDNSLINAQILEWNNELKLHLIPDRYVNLYVGSKFESINNDYIAKDTKKAYATGGIMFRFGDTYRSGVLTIRSEFKYLEKINSEKNEDSEFKFFLHFTGFF